ncbi:MAG: FixH family protein [Sulfuricurvum sp.]|nr:FixH family protein [Sulfuricurvum sp.]
MFKNPGTKWPVIIALSIAGVVGMSIMTIKIASKNPVEMSDYGMQSYHEYDADVNKIIASKIEFDKRYELSFLTPQITEKEAIVTYKVTDKEGKAVNDAVIEALFTRPDMNQYDINLSNPVIKDGVYTFSPVDLPKAGRWDIMAKVTIGDVQRYFNLKTDTRNPQTIEF